jgi:hypothetical protein
VFVERKTHRDSWTGNLSAKERFTLLPADVPALLQGAAAFAPVNARLVAEMRAAGKKPADIVRWQALVTECVQLIEAKQARGCSRPTVVVGFRVVSSPARRSGACGVDASSRRARAAGCDTTPRDGRFDTFVLSPWQLVPKMRTQYSRTAFQLPNDAAVRISLDTNLTMMCERDERAEAVSDDDGLDGRWYRDPRQAVPADQITRFPHAVLEVKIESLDGATGEPPDWVADLLATSCAQEVQNTSANCFRPRRGVVLRRREQSHSPRSEVVCRRILRARRCGVAHAHTHRVPPFQRRSLLRRCLVRSTSSPSSSTAAPCSSRTTCAPRRTGSTTRRSRGAREKMAVCVCRVRISPPSPRRVVANDGRDAARSRSRARS